MTKTVSFVIMLIAMIFLAYTPILAGEKNKARYYKDQNYWIFKSDPDAKKSGWQRNQNWGSTYESYGYDGNSHNDSGHSGKGGKKK